MNVSQSLKQSFSRSLISIKSQKGMLYVVTILLALTAFEAFNFGTTDYALTDLLGDLSFFGVRWATLLSIAFCVIDFTGIARLFGSQPEKTEHRSTWFMFGAWFLAATMNAILTWWGVVMAMENHSVLSASIVDASFLGKSIPIFISLMVWVIRVLLIGSLSRQGEQVAKKTQNSGPEGMSRREYRQAQSRAAHGIRAQSSVPAGMRRSAIIKPAKNRRQRKTEATYIPVQEGAAFRTMKAPGQSHRRI